MLAKLFLIAWGKTKKNEREKRMRKKEEWGKMRKRKKKDGVSQFASVKRNIQQSIHLSIVTVLLFLSFCFLCFFLSLSLPLYLSVFLSPERKFLERKFESQKEDRELERTQSTRVSKSESIQSSISGVTEVTTPGWMKRKTNTFFFWASLI